MFGSRKKENTEVIEKEAPDVHPFVHVADSLRGYQRKLVVNEVESLDELQKIQKAFDIVIEENQELREHMRSFQEIFGTVGEAAGRFQEPMVPAPCPKETRQLVAIINPTEIETTLRSPSFFSPCSEAILFHHPF